MPSSPSLSISCREDHDFYLILLDNGISCARFDDPQKAIESSQEGGAVLILADEDSDTRTLVGKSLLKVAKDRHLRVYWEFPHDLSGMIEGTVRKSSRLERAIVSCDDFGSTLPSGSLMTLPGCDLISLLPVKALITFGKVAGFDVIAFPIDTVSTEAILFQLPDYEVLIATAKLSHFRRGRFSPVASWIEVWKYLLRWLTRSNEEVIFECRAVAGCSFSRDELLPANAEENALKRGVNWFYRAHMFLPNGKEEAYQQETSDTHPPILDWPVGDGSAGILEGFSSTIDCHGFQPVRWWRRADCNGEAAGALAVAGLATDHHPWSQAAENLGDWLLTHSMLSQGDRADARHPAYGLLGWHDRSKYGIYADGWGVYYGDDNARALLGIMAASGALRTNRWDRSMARCILANFRTTGKEGFRANRIDNPQLEENGWKYYFEASLKSYSPHFQAYLWAVYLWVYSKTDDPFLLERTVNAIRETMAAYPNQWHWTNGIQQERARMILSLAWLVRVSDAPEHREWLDFMVEELLVHQDESGAIQEQIGETEGLYGPPRSHEDYGRAEAPLLQKNGDAVADLLYTTNFALLGLHEAAAATGCKRYRQAADHLAQFVVRSQVRSERPELDGAWFRAFDFKRWEHWGSDSDGDWGAWCIETGWTQSWITLVLALRKMETSLWQLGSKSQIKRHYDEGRFQMLSPTEDFLKSLTISGG